MLACGSVTYFHEDQHFRGSVLWVAVLIGLSIAVLMVAVAGSPRAEVGSLITAAVVGVLLTAIFAFARLETEVRNDGVYVHFHGLWPTRRIPLADIEAYEARRYSILESGGWGVHFTMRGMAYNVTGNTGLIIHLKTGKGGQVLIGTQRPEEFATALGKAMAGRGRP